MVVDAFVVVCVKACLATQQDGRMRAGYHFVFVSSAGSLYSVWVDIWSSQYWQEVVEPMLHVFYAVVGGFSTDCRIVSSWDRNSRLHGQGNPIGAA